MGIAIDLKGTTQVNAVVLFEIFNFDELTVSRNHYDLLGISSSADGETLRKAFCKLSKELHPDTTLLPHSEASQKFQQVCEAYELLADPELREAYDLSLSKRELNNEILRSKSELFVRNYFHNKNFVGDRRPLSGGELFSLLLLGLALLISLSLAIGFGILHGREFIVRPTWLTVTRPSTNSLLRRARDASFTTKHYSFKPTFVKGS